MKNNNKYYDTFCGHKVSDYGLEHGRLDYATMSKCFDAVLCNNIAEIDHYLFDNIECGDFEIYYKDGEEITREEYEEKTEALENEIEDIDFIDWDELGDKKREKLEAKREALKAELEKYERTNNDIFQYFIVSNNALDLLKEAGEIVFYCEPLDVYVWGVTHWGTSWDYVLTSIKLREREEE